LFFKHDPEDAADTGVTIGGGIKIASAAYADDSGVRYGAFQLRSTVRSHLPRS